MLPWVALWVAAYAQISDDEDLLKRRARRNDEGRLYIILIYLYLNFYF